MDSRFQTDHQKKESIRELAALVRTAADATGRAAELMLRWISTDGVENQEMRTLRLLAEDLLNGNELVAKLAADRFRLDLAVVESKALKLACDAATCLRTVTKDHVKIMRENNRLALKLKWPRRRRTDRP